MAASFRGVAPRRGAEQGEELLDLLGIADRAEHLPGQLSGGEQQRLAFAQAVIGRPALVVADEPTSELDSATTADLLAAVHSADPHRHDRRHGHPRPARRRRGRPGDPPAVGRGLARGGRADGGWRSSTATAASSCPRRRWPRFAARRVLIDITPEGVILREPT